MRPVFISCLAIALTWVATPLSAAEVSNFEAKTTRDLVKLCSAPDSNEMHEVAMGYCLGFVDAAADYHQTITSGDLLKPIACPKGDVTRMDIVNAFLGWAKTNDGLLDGESPIHGLMRAVTDEWPCA